MKKILTLLLSISIYINATLIDVTDSKFFIIEVSNDNYYIYDKNKINIIDILTNKINNIFVDYNQNRYFIIDSFLMNIPPDEDINCKQGVYADAYAMHIYKKYNNFFLKILNYEMKYDGYEGDFYCKKEHYKYKELNKITQLNNTIKITVHMILNSLEQFITSKYTKENKLLFTFKDSSFDIETLKAILDDIPIALNTLTSYNNIAYYLEKAGAYEESAYLLEKILEKFPNRTVAHYNLGDAYWGLGEKDKAIASYQTYIQQMKANGKEKRIPQVVLDRVSGKK